MKSEVFSVNSGATVVAHELKAPLALMRQLALSVELEENLDEAKRINRQIVRTSERAIRQVNDLVKISRLDDALFEMEPVNPRLVCDEVIAELWKMFRFNRREVKIEYKNKRKLVMGNKDLLYSVVYNFCLNAMNYGGEEMPSRIIVADRRNDRVRIEVRDYGPTISTTIWHEIKKGFVEQPLEIAMRPGSSGLGLYIASKFSNYMHGDFGLVRHRDGTSFYLDLPISGQLSFL